MDLVDRLIPTSDPNRWTCETMRPMRQWLLSELSEQLPSIALSAIVTTVTTESAIIERRGYQQRLSTLPDEHQAGSSPSWIINWLFQMSIWLSVGGYQPIGPLTWLRLLRIEPPLVGHPFASAVDRSTHSTKRNMTGLRFMLSCNHKDIGRLDW